MKTNDYLLYQMIEQDLKAKGCTCKQITDKLAHNPTAIEVGGNEVVYVHFFHTGNKAPFSVKLSSPNTIIEYNEHTTINGSNNLITRNWGKIKIKGALPENFYLHYVSVKF